MLQASQAGQGKASSKHLKREAVKPKVPKKGNAEMENGMAVKPIRLQAPAATPRDTSTTLVDCPPV